MAKSLIQEVKKLLWYDRDECLGIFSWSLFRVLY